MLRKTLMLVCALVVIVSITYAQDLVYQKEYGGIKAVILNKTADTDTLSFSFPPGRGKANFCFYWWSDSSANSASKVDSLNLRYRFAYRENSDMESSALCQSGGTPEAWAFGVVDQNTTSVLADSQFVPLANKHYSLAIDCNGLTRRYIQFLITYTGTRSDTITSYLSQDFDP